VEELGVINWTKLDEKPDISTLLPPCEYIHITLGREPNKTVSELFKDIKCKRGLDYESIETTKFRG
jgi:hypothetical protein